MRSAGLKVQILLERLRSSLRSAQLPAAVGGGQRDQIRTFPVIRISLGWVSLNCLVKSLGCRFLSIGVRRRISEDGAEIKVVAAGIRRIDLRGLLPPRDRAKADVLNGIAYDAAGDRLFVTGKLWPKIFEIKLTPGK